MARTKHCPVCEGDQFKRVIVTLPSGSDRDTDFVYCRRCLLVFYRNPESRSVEAPSIKTTELLRTMSAAVINEAMRKLPDPNLDGDDTLSIEHYVDYHGKVKIEFERTTGQSSGHTWRFWAAKTASKVT